MFTLKIFYFRYDSRAETHAKLKTDLYFVKLIMRKVSYIPLENMTPCQECQEKVEFSIVEEADSSHFLINLF